MIDFAANDADWKARLRKERQAHNVHCQVFYAQPREEMFPPVPKQCTGEQARQLAIQRQHGSASVPTLAPRQSKPASFRRGQQVLNRPPLAVASHGLGAARNGRRPSVRSSMTSLPSTPGKSCSSKLTSESLRREIAQAVQEQVATIMEPLQKQLEGETLARQRAEAALREAGLPCDA
mmetsp:Transcript_1762/g.4489  ORF Transcript_1762/g.4489 Transcript_1762/m.4489 type:complete len:178 (-) Transcript_1762:118-651(-)